MCAATPWCERAAVTVATEALNPCCVFLSSAGRSTTSWSTGRSSTRATWSLPATTQVNQTFVLSAFMFDYKTDFKIKRCLKSWEFSSSLPHIRPEFFLNHFHTQLSWQMDVCKRFSVKTAWFLHVIECRMWSDRKLCKYTVIDTHLSSCVWPFTFRWGQRERGPPWAAQQSAELETGTTAAETVSDVTLTLKSCDEWADTFKNTGARSPAFFSYSTHLPYRLWYF